VKHAIKVHVSNSPEKRALSEGIKNYQIIISLRRSSKSTPLNFNSQKLSVNRTESPRSFLAGLK